MTPNTFLIIDIETIPDLSIWSPQETNEFPPPFAHQIIVIGVAWLEESYKLKKVGIVAENQTEHVILREFSQFMDRYRPIIVTFNGRRFDLPVILHRALKYGIPIKWYFEGKYRLRHNEEAHIDLWDELSNYGSGRSSSLDSISKLIGLPGKTEIDGTMITRLFKEGELEKIKNYCLEDVIHTLLIFLRYNLIK